MAATELVTLYGPDGSRIGSSTAVATTRDLTLDEITKLYLSGVDMSNAPTDPSHSFRQQATVYSCVDRIATTLAGVPATVRRRKDDAEITEGDLAQLFRTPSPRRSLYSLIYATTVSLELRGNGLWWADWGEATKRPGLVPRRFVPLPAARCIPVASDDGHELVGIIYVDKHGRRVPVPADELIHMQYPSEDNPLWGQGTLEAARNAVRLDLSAAIYSQRFYQNSAMVSSLLINEDKMRAGEKEEARREFEEIHKGLNRSHKTAVLTGGWNYVRIGSTLNELNIVPQREFERMDISSAFNVPNLLLNKTDNIPLATARILLRLFYQTNWGPKANMIADDVNAQFFSIYFPEYYFSFEVARSPSANDAILEQVDALSALTATGVPLNKAKDLLGMPIEDVPWGDTHFIMPGMMPAEAVLALANEDPPAEDDTTDPADDDQPGDQANAPRIVFGHEQLRVADVATRSESEGMWRDVYWAAYAHSLHDHEVRFARAIRGHIREVRMDQLKRLHAAASTFPVGRGVHQRGLFDAWIEGVLFDLKTARDALRAKMADPLRKAMIEGGKQAYGDLDIGDAFTLESSFALSSLRTRQKLISRIDDTVWRHVKQQIKTGLEAGEGIGAISDRLKTRVFQPSSQRALTIARTEVGTAVQYGRASAMEQAGVEYHSWVSSRDDHVRTLADGGEFDHLIDEETVVFMRETFSTGLRWPLDASSDGSKPGNIINCRCTTVPAVSRAK